jgi:hypothetical protein
MENPMIIIILLLIFAAIGGIAFYYFVIREDEPTATTAPSEDLAGDILAGFNDNFSNIKKRVEHFTTGTPTPTNPCLNDPYYYYNSGERDENYCDAKNDCQFNYFSSAFPDEQGCNIRQYVPFNTNNPDHYDPIWIDVTRRLQSLNYIPACAADSTYASNLGSLTDGFVDMTLNNLLELSHEQKIRNLKNVLKEPFLRASSIIDNFINLMPYITVYECGNQNLPCECDGFKQYLHDYNNHSTKEDKALAFVTLMFGYDQNLSFESNVTRIEGNLWMIFNRLIQVYGEPFCFENINNLKAYVRDFNNAISNGQSTPNFIVSDEIVATIALVFSTFFICMNAGVIGNPRSSSDDNEIRFEFNNEGTNVNIIERYKFRLSRLGYTIPPEGRGSTFGLQEIEEGHSLDSTENIQLIPLFIMMTREMNEFTDYNLLTCS